MPSSATASACRAGAALRPSPTSQHGSLTAQDRLSHVGTTASSHPQPAAHRLRRHAHGGGRCTRWRRRSAAAASRLTCRCLRPASGASAWFRSTRYDTPIPRHPVHLGAAARRADRTFSPGGEQLSFGCRGYFLALFARDTPRSARSKTPRRGVLPLLGRLPPPPQRGKQSREGSRPPPSASASGLKRAGGVPSDLRVVLHFREKTGIQ